MSLVWILLTLLPVLGGAERFNCKGRILGAYYADVKAGCKAFHVCVRVAGGGIRDFRFFCPPGTLFHREAQTCTDWGDDDPLACPADIYDDGQFDLYKIGSGFDTKKLSSSGNREEEVEYGLQRAETGDRRLAQNRQESDLRAAHSSDFFSGQRDRGRDDAPSTAAPSSLPPTQQPQQRQSFRRPTSQRTFATLPSTQYTPAPSSPQPSNQPRHEGGSKRKLVRKRPIYVSTKPPTTPSPPPPQPSPTTVQTYSPEPQQQNFNRRAPPPQNRQTITTPVVPPQYKQYKDEYVEVPRVTPKQKNRIYYNNSPTTSFVQSTAAPRPNKKDGLIELYNYDSISTPGLNVQNENNFKVKNNFNVQDVRKDRDFAPLKNVNYNTVRDVSPTAAYSVSARTFPTSTPTYNNNNYNSVSYEPEKSNYLPYSKVKNFSPSTSVAPATKSFRPEVSLNFNTVAYNTNNGFQSDSSNRKNDEDDGQYHPPQGEDDGLYKPELYDPEILSGAHSLNIAASGNRLPEDRKVYNTKTPAPQKPTAQTAVPRPFRPASTPIALSTSRAPEPTYPTSQQAQTQRTFDYFQTYTTTSRPTDYVAVGQGYSQTPEAPKVTSTVPPPRVAETRAPRPESRAPPTSPPSPASPAAPTVPAPSSPPARPTTRAPHFARPANNKEDNSYDYAYYDSDSGFSEYDHLEEFGKTKTRA